MGATVTDVSLTQGFNGSASSLSFTLVEDIDNGDNFVSQAVPQLRAFSLPSGGIDAPLFYPSGYTMHPDSFTPSNVPFYFCGVLQGYKEDTNNTSGKKITGEIAGVDEVLRGVQCLLGGFALGQLNLFDASGAKRYDNVKNVIDVFGYYDYGMESNLNEFGMEWSKIKTCLENIRCTVFDMNFEFTFTGECFEDTPSWYRVKADIIDFVSLVNHVAKDGGSDVVYVARKTSSDTAVVEVRGMRRENDNVLAQSEINSFISARSDIVSFSQVGREFRNEPDSHIIMGGNRNKNYVAYPTRKTTFGNTGSIEEWPENPRIRFFGGGYTVPVFPTGSVTKNHTPEVGSIIPYWGMTPSGQVPMAEPYLSLDHLSFRDTTNVQPKIPLLTIVESGITVRTRTHSDVFLTGDGASDTRPFGVIAGIRRNQASKNQGEIRGIPLNDEVMLASLIGEDFFYSIYKMYYPDIANDLLFPAFNFSGVLGLVTALEDAGHSDDEIIEYLQEYPIDNFSYQFQERTASNGGEIDEFNRLIYNAVAEFSDNVLGKKYTVCLPKSFIMNRIFNGQTVPTRIDKPDIEYVVDGLGYWETLPSEFDGLSNTVSGSLEERQILDKFMAEDGRFAPMFVMNLYPSGNGSIWSDGQTQVMLQDLPTSEYRPNLISQSVPDRVYISTNGIDQLVKRPDLAIVNVNGVVRFDPLDIMGGVNMTNFDSPSTALLPDNVSETAWLLSRGQVAKFLWNWIRRSTEWRAVFGRLSPTLTNSKLSTLVNRWTEQLVGLIDNGQSTESLINGLRVLDPEAIIIPLTSTWVSYGPWVATESEAKGMVEPTIISTLVPWNFERPPSASGWDANLNAAGQEQLNRTISEMDYVDVAVIRCAGFPELGIASTMGFNSNLSSVSVSFGVGGIETTYILSSYLRKPGTFRKTDFDNISELRFKNPTRLDDVRNINLSHVTESANGGIAPNAFRRYSGREEISR